VFIANADSKKDLKEWYRQKNKKGVHGNTMNKLSTRSLELVRF
jgi:hypothetical protein